MSVNVAIRGEDVVAAAVTADAALPMERRSAGVGPERARGMNMNAAVCSLESLRAPGFALREMKLRAVLPICRNVFSLALREMNFPLMRSRGSRRDKRNATESVRLRGRVGAVASVCSVPPCTFASIRGLARAIAEALDPGREAEVSSCCAVDCGAAGGQQLLGQSHCTF